MGAAPEAQGAGDRDSAGKGGVIKRITQRLNPRVCRVAALPASNERERTRACHPSVSAGTRWKPATHGQGGFAPLAPSCLGLYAQNFITFACFSVTSAISLPKSAGEPAI